MAQRPLLIFPTPGDASRSNLNGGGQKFSQPSAANQNARLNPKLQELRDALEAQRLVLQQNAAGVDPEYVLVFETVGSIEDFANAIRKIEGFEWLGELRRSRPTTHSIILMLRENAKTGIYQDGCIWL